MRLFARVHVVIALLSLLGVSLFASSCVRPPEDGSSIDKPAAAAPPSSATTLSVAAHTSGTVSTESTIRVAFTGNIVETAGPVDPSPLTFEPPIEGEARFSRLDELEFDPQKPLPRGQQYTGKIDLGALGVPGGTVFSFTFAALKQGFDLSLDGVEVGSGGARHETTVRGHIATNDVADPSAVEKALSAMAPEQNVKIAWEHDDNRKDHRFTVTGLERIDDDYSLTLRFDGDAIGTEDKRELVQRIPGLNTFSVLMAKAIQDAPPHLEVRFSDPVDDKQDLRGLITIKDQDDCRLVVKGNVVEVYGKRALPRSVELAVAPGLKNKAGFKLKKGGSYAIEFERLKPAVRFVGKGTIVPSTDGLTIPIETANLRRLTIEALRVPEQNLPQFFQVNRYDGDNELKRVGRVVWKRTVDLGDAKELDGAWTRSGLALTNLVRQERSGMIRLRLTFDRSDILYRCTEEELAALGDGAVRGLGTSGQNEEGNWDDENQSSYWDSYEGNYWDDYENRDNPCHPGYYRHYGDHDIAQTRNVLLSDLGLIAKRGSAGDVFAVVTDLKTANPVAGATVELLDYQQQVMATARTNSDGKVTLKADQRPFLLVASARGDKGFLRLDEGAALSTAHFDTSGATVKAGLKGMFYGERGVWRPGDKIFLTFVLSDRDRPLPGAHPLHFTLKDPRGKVIHQEVRKESNDGFYVFKLATAHDAPTGNYTAEARVGGTSFSHVLKVEAIRPNRLKIGLESSHEVLKPNEGIDTDLSSQWLHGATASGLKAEVEVAMVPRTTRFPAFSEYRFDAPTRRLSASKDTVFVGNLDDDGKVKLDQTLSFDGEAAGMLTAAFTTRVYEKSGAFSIDRHSLPFSPYERYVGVRLPPGDKARGMLLTDEKHKARFVVVDEKGEKVKGNVALKVKLYKINWRWWWEKGEESLADYAGSRSHHALQTATVQVKDGLADWEFEIKYPDWGRYLVVASDEKGGHESGWIFYCDWPGWAGRAQKDQPGGATVLSLATDKTSYEVGEEVSLTIPSSVAGRALVSLENGSRVVRSDWVKTAGKAVQYTFKVTGDMAPNVFAHVTLLQPHLEAGNDLPIRLYGVTPIRVVDPSTKLSPQIDAPKSFEPGKVAHVKVREAGGQPMTYTLAIVDEGLLGLTRYQTPNPWSFFYAREALGVKTWDLFDEVAGAYGGQLENLLAIGGDGEGDDGGRQRANRFPPMVVFKGPFTLDAGETKAHAVQLPPYVGAVRVMVVGGHDDAYGKAEQEVFVRKPLIVLPSLPRVVGPGEEVALPVAVFALEDKIKDVKVTVKGNDVVKVIGQPSHSVTFKKIGDQIVPFKLKVAERLGIAKLTITASGGGETATYEVELDVRHPGTRVTSVESKTLDQDAVWTLDKLPLKGLVGTNEATLEISRMPPLDLERRLRYLVRYPHGCVEQTTSAAFPQVHLEELVDLSAAQKADVEKHIKAAIDKLRGFQNTDGGFGYWPTDRSAHDWSTSWVGHFLLEAKRAGYNVPSDMISRWTSFQREAARRADGQTDDHTQAYRLYTLALAGKADVGAMNRLKEREQLSAPARFRLAAAYQLARQGAAAKALVIGATTSVSADVELGGTFSSPLRQQAMILETLVLLDDDNGAMTMARSIAEELAKDRGYNTQATAFALVAMSRWASKLPSGDKQVLVDVSFGSRDTVTLKGDTAVLQLPLQPTMAEQASKPKLVVTNRGETVFARLIHSGLPGVGEEKASDNGVKISVAYAKVEGGAVDVARVEQGTDVSMTVTVTNASPGVTLHELALSHLVPSGFELRNERLDIGLLRSGAFEYQDVRDDRVLTYFDLPPGGSKTFNVVAHAAYPGHYYLPPVAVEAMYDPTIQARTRGTWMQIVDAPSPGN
jgi:uncharacterized protein YfaS (alpha-2-macroglobulin family)